MGFPLSFSDLATFLTIISIILIITNELLPSRDSKTKILLNRKKLGQASLITVTIAIGSIILFLYSTML